MKKFIKRTLTCVLILASALSAKADYDFKVNGIPYNIKSLENKTCVVCNPNGGAWIGSSPYYTGDIVIPSTVSYNGASFTVVGIDPYAFYGSYLTSITIPNTVEEISMGAFQSCENLKSVKLPNQLITIGESAFAGCKSLKSIRLPSQLQSIGDVAFGDCPLQGRLIIPKSCHKIGSSAFVRTKISTVIIPHQGDMKALNMGSYCFPTADSLYIGTDLGMYIRYNSMKDFNDIFFNRAETHTSLYDVPKLTFGDSVRHMPGMKEQQYGIALKKLTIGYNIQRVPLMPNHIMGKIYMRNPNPPLADGFTDRTYVNAILYVPRGSKSAYKSAYTWAKFVNIQEYDVHLPSSVQEFNKKVIIDGYECVEINGLYWRTKNIGASSPYDVGTNFYVLRASVLLDSIKVWEAKGWRIAGSTELEKLLCTWHGNGYKTSVHYHVYHSDIVDGNKFYYGADIYKPYLIFPVMDNIDDYCGSDGRITKTVGLVRLVMDKSRIEKQLAEQRKKEEQQRRKEEEDRLKARYNEINKLVEKNGATYAVSGSDMLYEFALENTNARKDKSKAHTFVLRYAKNGALYMAINNGAANELETLLPDTKLEGTSKQWSEGYYKIATSSSNADVAKELSRILQGMCTAKDKFQQRKKAEKEEKMQESRINYAAWQLASLMAWPCGITSYDWKDSNKNIKKNILSVYPNMEVKMNVLQGNIKGIYIEIADGIELQNYHSYINLKPAKENRIAVQYTFSILKKRKLYTDQDSEIYANTLNCIKTILTDHLHFSQSQDGSYKIRNLKDKVDIEDLKISVNKYGGIQLNFNVIR